VSTRVRRVAPARIGQWLRYGAVSLIATATSVTVLGVLVSTTTIPAGVANVVATAVGTFPSFELNRRWVWRRSGRRSVRAELVPFWILSFTGLALSTLSVTAAAAWADAAGLQGLARTAAVEVANLAAWGSLWVAQFLILDRFLFRPHATATPVPMPDAAPLIDEAA
jgi:putative flippase GtrA